MWVLSFVMAAAMVAQISASIAPGLLGVNQTFNFESEEACVAFLENNPVNPSWEIVDNCVFVEVEE